jgi:hypothetical protein
VGWTHQVNASSSHVFINSTLWYDHFCEPAFHVRVLTFGCTTCLRRLGVGAGWDVTLDADYARIQNCAFAAAGPGIGRSEAVDNLDVALSVLRVHQTFLRTQPQLQRLTRIVHEAPKMRDTMQVGARPGELALGCNELLA